MAVRETLELNVAPAEAAVQRLAGGLEAALRNAISAALGGSYTASVKGDARDVESAVSSAVESATDEKQVQGDASDVEAAVTTAVEDATDDKTVVGEASDVQAAIDNAVADSDDTKVVQADASEVTSAIDGAIESANDTIRIGADTTGVEASLAGVTDSANGVAGATEGINDNLLQAATSAGLFGTKAGGALAGAATPIGAAAVAVGGLGLGIKAATSEFAAFEYQLSEVRTLLPQLSDAEIRQLEDSVMAVSSELGIATEQLIPALYQALSAGVPADNVMDFIRTAGAASIGGVTTLEVAVDGLTSIINAWGLEASEAGRAADVLFVGMKAGKTTVEQLSNSMFQVAPIAASLGLRFEEVVAGMSAITNNSVPTRQAANMLKRMMTELGDSTTQVGTHFEAVAGMSFREFVAAGGTLQEALALLTQRAESTGVSIDQLFSSSVAAQGALVLTGGAAESFAKTSEAAFAANGEAAEAAAKINDTLARRVETLRVRFGDLWLIIGRELAPVLKDLVGVATDLTGVLTTVASKGASVLGWLRQFGVFTSITRALVQGLTDTVLGLIPVVGPMLKAAADFGQANRETGKDTTEAKDAAAEYDLALAELEEELNAATGGSEDLAASVDAAGVAMDRFAADAASNIPSIIDAFDELSAERGTDQILADLDRAFEGTQVWNDDMARLIAEGSTNLAGLMAQLGAEKSRVLLESYSGDEAALEAHLARLAFAEMAARVAARETAVRQYLEMQGVVGAAQDQIVEEVRARLVLEEPTVEALEQAAEAVGLDTSVPSSMAQAAGRSVQGWLGALDLVSPTTEQVLAINNLLALTNLGAPSEAMARSAVEAYNERLPDISRFTAEQVDGLVAIMTGSGLPDAAAGVGADTVQQLTQGIQGGQGAVTGAVNTVTGSATDAARQVLPRFYSEGIAISQQTATGIRLGSWRVREAAASLGATAISGINSTNPRSQAIAIGRDIADGVAEGIRTRSFTVAQAAEQMVREAVRRAREAAEANSPSRVFAQLGGDMAEGLAVGMEANTSQVVAAAEQMLRDVNAAAGMGADLNVTPTSSVQAITVSVPVTVTGSVSADEGARFGQEAGAAMSRELRSMLRFEGLVA